MHFSIHLIPVTPTPRDVDAFFIHYLYLTDKDTEAQMLNNFKFAHPIKW